MLAPIKQDVFNPFTTKYTSPLTPYQVKQVLRSAAWGLAMIEIVISYEWLLSGLDKVLSAKYVLGLADVLRTSIQDNPNRWWVAFIQQQVIPHAQVWAILVEIAELFVALGFFAGALLWVSGCFPIARWTRCLNVGVLLAICGGVLMTANYYLMAGHSFPGFNPGAPFDEGLSLDGVLTAIGLGLLLIHLAVGHSHGLSDRAPTQHIAKSERRKEERQL